MNQANPAVDLTQRENFLFSASFGKGLPELLVDEPEPIGSGKGPSPEQLLIASVANCLASSLFFALNKFRNVGTHLRTHAEAVIGRNDQGRLRVMEIRVDITLDKPASSYLHLDRAISQFEEFCTVSRSVGQGLPVNVFIRDSNGKVLK